MAIKKLAFSSLMFLLLLFIFSRVYFLAIASIPTTIRPDLGYLGNQVANNEPKLAWIWANMDGRHFIKIATLGYTGTNFAYFPLYPLLINLISRIGLAPIYSGIAISVISTILSVILLYRLFGVDKRKGSPIEAIFMLLFFPFSFVLSSVYADAFFLFLTIGSFYFARTRRWFISGIFAFFASLTRLTGIALIPALALEWWLQKPKNKRGLIAPLLSLFGFITYPLYLQLQHDNWRLFQVSMSAWKQDQLVLLPQVIFRYLKILTSVSATTLVYWVAVLELVSFSIYFTLALYVYRKIRASYGLFMIIVLLLVTFTGTLAGTPRYLAHLFPAFIGIAYLFQKHPTLRLIYYPVTIILGIILTALFVQGRFIS